MTARSLAAFVRWLQAATLLVTAHFLALPVLAQQPPANDSPAATDEGSRVLLTLPRELADLPRSSKIGTRLLLLARDYETYRASGESGPFVPSRQLPPVVRDRVVIDAAADGPDGESAAIVLLQRLETLGLENGAWYGRLVSGLLPLDSIRSLEELSELRFVRASAATLGVGLTTSQGDEAMRADIARSLYGVDGSGVDVGVLSDSFDCLGGAAGDVASNDLPTGIVVLEEAADCGPRIDEGRAMMQLIHDVAPGSSQLFHTAIGGMANFAMGIADLAGAGADVIVDDVLYFFEPMFQDGPIAQAVDSVVASGVSYFSAAGNFGRNAYESPFRASGIFPFGNGEEAHDFDPGGGIDVFQQFTLAPGVTQFTLQWDSPYFSVSGSPGSSNDLNIYLVDDPPTMVVGQVNVSNVGADPIEYLEATVSGSSPVTINLLITRVAGPNPGALKLVVDRSSSTFLEYETNSGTLYGHANAVGAEAIGAAFYLETPELGTDPPLVEPFSAAGPMAIFFDTQGNPVSLVRQKPELVCPDGTNTTFFGQGDVEPDGFPNFFGTSAAAPHAAAVAALMLELEPTLTPAQVYAALEGTAIDMAQPGVDFDTGYGLCQADAALGAIATTSILIDKQAVPTSIPEPGGPVQFDVTVTNNGNTTYDLDSLVDDIHGNVDGQGTCSVPQSIAVGGSYACSFTANVVGPPGTSETDTVTASGTGPGGNDVQASDTATVTVVGSSETEIDVDPGVVIFARRGIQHGPSKAQTVTITNFGSDPLSIFSVALGGMDPTEFSILSDSGEGTLAMLEQRIVEVAFDPLTTGARSAQLSVTSSDPDEPQVDVLLRGEGIFVAGPELEVSPLAMNFGPQAPGSGPTPAQTLLASNQGSSSLSFTLSLEGSDAEEFGFGGIALSGNGNSVTINADSIDVVLTPSSSFSIGVFFNPTSAGQKSGLVRFESNDADESVVEVVLTGNGGPLDFGDAPDSNPSILPTTYPTLLSSNGARHTLGSGLYLGAGVDTDADGQPDASASGDDVGGADDEDGVTFSQLGRDANASADVVASAPGRLSAWVDWNQDGDWLDADEQIFTDQVLAAGVNSGLTFTVPADASLGATFARFRFSSSTGLSPTGLAPDGEVEDFTVTIVRGDRIGAYRPSLRLFLRDADGSGTWNPPADTAAVFGATDDVPLTGDWNGDGHDEIGVYRPTTRQFLLDVDGNDVWNLPGDVAYVFGVAGDIPLVGDWNGDGDDDIGVYRPASRVFLLDLDESGSWTPASDQAFLMGLLGDTPLIGDWNGDGDDDIGIYRPSNRVFLLDYDESGTWTPATDLGFLMGLTGDQPLAGDWNGDGDDNIGVYRPSIRVFLLDADEGGTWTPATDLGYGFGVNGDIPLAGFW